MPAFNSSAAYRDSAGVSRESMEWNAQQFQDWLSRMVDSGNITNELRNELIYHAREQISQGFPAPDVIRQIANDVVPGVEDAIQRRAGRLNTIQELFQNRTPASETMGRIFDNVNAQAGDITRTQDMSMRDIEDTAGRIAQRNDIASNDVIRNIQDTTAGLQTGLNDTFGRLNRSNANVTDAVARANEDTTRQLRSNAATTYGRLEGANRDVNAALRSSADTAFSRVGDLSRTAYGNTRAALTSTIGDLRQGAVNTAADLTGRSDRTFQDLEGDTGATFNRLNRATGDTFSRLNTRTGDTFDRLNAGTEDAYTQAIADAEQLDPIGEAVQARVARSFAPAMAATMARLRRRGVGADEAQAQAIIGEVERNRARAMDDSAAQFGAENVDRINTLRQNRQQMRNTLGTGELDRNITLGTGELDRSTALGTGELDRRTDLATRRLMNYQDLQNDLRDTMERLGLTQYTQQRDINLAELDTNSRNLLNRELMQQGLSLGELQNQMTLARAAQAEDRDIAEGGLARGTDNARTGQAAETSLGIGALDRQTQLSQGAGADYRNEVLRRMNTDSANDLTRAGAVQQNLDSAYQRTTDWRTRADQANLLERAMQNEDWQTAANLLREANGEELTAMDVRQLAYARGQDWVAQNFGRRDAGLANMANMYARQQADTINSAGVAQGFNDRWNRDASQTMSQEAGRGNWGTRLAVGAGGGLLNAVAPGVGTLVTQAAEPLLLPQQSTGQRAGSQGQGGGFGGQGQGFGWQGTQAQPSTSNAWNQIFQRGAQWLGIGGGGGNSGPYWGTNPQGTYSTIQSINSQLPAPGFQW